MGAVSALREGAAILRFETLSNEPIPRGILFTKIERTVQIGRDRITLFCNMPAPGAKQYQEVEVVASEIPRACRDPWSSNELRSGTPQNSTREQFGYS